MSDSPLEPRPVVAWMQVLGRIEDTLGQSLAQEEPPPPPPADGPEAIRMALQMLDDQLARLQACLDHAEKNATGAEALLVAEAQEIGRWQETFTAARQKLAGWAEQAASE